MSRQVQYLERFEYFCRECERKGNVLDVLLNPDVLLIRGFCPLCKKRGTYKVVDIEALRQEHDAIAIEETESRIPEVKPDAKVTWKWELQNGISGQTNKPDE